MGSEVNKENWAYHPREGTRPYLFLVLADPDEDGYSRPIHTSEFVGDYADLKIGEMGEVGVAQIRSLEITIILQEIL